MTGDIIKVRGGGYGLDAELAQRATERYDYGMEKDAQVWIESITELQIGESFGEGLKNGVIICHLVNKIHPGIVPRIEVKSKITFRLMENVSSFLKACRTIGVSEFDLFETVDLFELKDLGVVVRCLHALGRAVQKNYPDFDGPKLGVKESIKNERHFSKKKIAEAASAPSLISLGSLRTMERLDISRSNDVTFGADIAAKYNRAPPLPPPPSNEKVKQIFQELESEENVNVESDDVIEEEAHSTTSLYEIGDSKTEAQSWIETVTGEKFKDDFETTLKDGVLLCTLMNKIVPGLIPKIENASNPFKKMENISHFIKACRKLGVAEFDLFETIDLSESKNISLVINCIHALGRTIQKTMPEFIGPTLGVREATANPRTFSEAQKKEANSAVPRMMMGSYGTMERSTVDQSSSVTFGSDAARSGKKNGSDFAGVHSTRTSEGSADVAKSPIHKVEDKPSYQSGNGSAGLWTRTKWS
uniref:Uncharacterized protein AlNc14C928G12640 n=2 Tax=Albugo laibachii Nc14 TaxID=890382 RepID=F0X2A4_9STRA|nr:conserved unknown protein putative [Albugo laibachii Nc14]|eukprot:CCA27984.1 conserved unknown protein putative [Albugo laibachii Nc14]